MKKHVLLFCIQFLVLQINAQENKDVEIVIDLNEKTEKISPLIYGQFIEFLGRCIDGGIYDENSPLTNAQGFRKDVLKKVQGLNPPVLRFPGGTVVKIYHWKDGIGKKENRPKRKNLIWGGNIDNHFGTAEFIQYCKAIGAEPFLVVNMSTDSPTDASDWVEYCNGTEDTYWANLRRSHGYKEPFNVKYWGIGNEEYAVTDAGKHQNVEDYIEDCWQFVKLMKLQDPSIKITLVGNSEDLEWSRKVVSQMHPVCDYLAIHLYAIPSDSEYTTLLQNIDQFDDQLDNMRTIIKEGAGVVQNFSSWYRFPPRQEPLKIAIDEWGIWDINSEKGTGNYNMEYPYNWSHALAVAKFLNMFQRNADIIGLATWAQMVNVLAPIMTTISQSYQQTIYTPLQAFRKYSQTNNLPITVNTPEMENNIKWIDVSASISDDGKEVVISVLNLSEKTTITVNIDFDNSNKKMLLTNQIIYTAPTLNSINTLDKNVVTETKINTTTKVTNRFKFSLQPASINLFFYNYIE